MNYYSHCLHRSVIHSSEMSRERQRGGGQSGGGQNLTRRPPTENSFRPSSPRYVLPPPPPSSISLLKSLRNSQKFPWVTSSETIFRGSPKRVSKWPSSRGFAFRSWPFSSSQTLATLILARLPQKYFYSVHTRGIKSAILLNLKVFLLEFLENRRS